MSSLELYGLVFLHAAVVAFLTYTHITELRRRNKEERVVRLDLADPSTYPELGRPFNLILDSSTHASFNSAGLGSTINVVATYVTDYDDECFKAMHGLLWSHSLKNFTKSTG